MTKQELYQWLDDQNTEMMQKNLAAPIFYLVRFSGQTKARQLEKCLYSLEGEEYQAYLCVLTSMEMSREDVMKSLRHRYPQRFVETAKKWEFPFYRNGIHYQIEIIEYPSLPEEIEDIRAVSAEECLEWLLRQKTRP